MLTLAFSTILLLAPTPASAKTTIAVLTFGGDRGASARAKLVSKLRRRYRIVSGAKILAACDDLGISLSRGKNLAQAAAAVGAVAVIGGSAGDGQLALAVYSGKTGQPLITGAVNWTNGSRRQMRAALTLLLRGLQRAPKRVRPPQRPAPPPPEPDPPPEPKPAPKPMPAPLPEKNAGGGDDSLSFDPEEGGDRDVASADFGGEEEDPLASAPQRRERPKKEDPEVTESKKAPEPEGNADPRVAGYVGLGTWIRSFTLSDPAPIANKTHPQYNSGAAFALQVAIRARPAAFFLDNFLANIWLRLRFQMVLGLSSQVNDASATAAGSLATSLNEFIFDLGYDIKFGKKAVAPHLEIGAGYGMLNFAIDWGQLQPNLPNAAYRYILGGAGFRYPFINWLGAHIRGDYRIVLDPGEIQKVIWYGPATVGGFSGTIGLHANFGRIVARAEYSYTRYFYTFTDAANQQATSGLAAGGALDQMHLMIVSGGYSY